MAKLKIGKSVGLTVAVRSTATYKKEQQAEIPAAPSIDVLKFIL